MEAKAPILHTLPLPPCLYRGAPTWVGSPGKEGDAWGEAVKNTLISS